MRRAEHVELTDEVKNAHKISVGNPERKNRLEDLGVESNIH